MEATCSFDPDDYVSWCGVLDPSIPEPEVIDSDWSFQESPPCAEDASPEQSQAWAVVSPDDVASTDSVQKAEALAAEADRTSSCSISDGDGEKIVVFSSLLPMLLPVERVKGKGKPKSKTKKSSCLICDRRGHFGRQRPTTGGGKGSEMEPARLESLELWLRLA